jgi:hypothetical protein
VETDEEEEEDDGPEEHCKPLPAYPVGGHVAALYDGNWYIAQVEAEEPEFALSLASALSPLSWGKSGALAYQYSLRRTCRPSA